MSSNEPAISTISKSFGEAAARAAVVYLLADALEFFNASETMSDVQAALTVDLIIEDYPYLKTDDIKLCLKNAMKQKYGKIYNRIDGSIVLGWFAEYNKERCAVAESQSINEANIHKREDLKKTEGMFYGDYINDLKERASKGDQEAIASLQRSNELLDRFSKMNKNK